MSFGGFHGGDGGGGGARIVADIPYNIRSQPLPKSIFSSPGLSLALQTTLEGGGGGGGGGGGEVGRMPESYENGGGGGGRRSREEEHESRSGSDNMDGGGSGDDPDGGDDGKPPRKKRYHRHTPQQIQELEALFKECPHPDDKQRLELSRRLCLETRQVKFWFQNRRTQMKTQLERHENSLLRQENDKLRSENMSIREAMRNPSCTSCGGPAMIGDISLEEQHLRIENARLKDELDRVCALAGKFLGRPISSMGPPMPNSSLELGVGRHQFHQLQGGGSGGVLTSSTSPLPLGPHDFGVGISNGSSVVPFSRASNNMMGIDHSLERSMYLELALSAMDELVKLAQSDEPLWLRSLESGHEVMNRNEYLRVITPCIGPKPNDYVSEASRESGMVIINSLALVETLMDSNKWAEMFPCMIARTSTTDVLSNGMGGSRNGALQLMHAELQVLSPLVPVREVNFLRFCKQHAEGVWAVVDVSVDTVQESPPDFLRCRRLPSGCVVQDMPNGYSKVTWVEHVEYDESPVHELYRPLIRSGMGFGAHRWVAALQRQCECLAILMSSPVPSRDHTGIHFFFRGNFTTLPAYGTSAYTLSCYICTGVTSSGRKSMLKLAQRMTDNFCAGVCASNVYQWNKLCASNVDEDVRVMTRQSVDDPGEPPGVVLSAATSVWLPVSPQRLFDFLRNERLRSEWDILSNGGPMQEMAHIAKGQDHGNSVSLLRASAMNANQSSMLILQETCIDSSGSMVVYAPVDIPAMHVVMNGGDSAYVALLPSGFAIVPDGSGDRGVSGTDNVGGRAGGSLLTVAFQILVNSLPTAKLTVESVETVNNLISCTVQKIKAAVTSES
ncbi:hypothetical protein SSX86_014879 [Deinandra increscens subsp. villosa]|uniref:Uncharacterized protein n=1 Tax=Deinandra increscens subsp. villosa TaxID=3103831 RepID=A0AAP0D2Z7_9ASTR